MRIAFRTDVSLQIGTGHVMRCLTLADALREQGAQCHFICRAHEGHLIDLIAERGYQVDALPKPDGEMSSTVDDLAHASWLGVEWSTDAQQTQQFFANTKFDWLIVDHYALDHRWESVLRSVCNRIMVIDMLKIDYSKNRYLNLVGTNTMNKTKNAVSARAKGIRTRCCAQDIKRANRTCMRARFHAQ